jgi:hypothetical protein
MPSHKVRYPEFQGVCDTKKRGAEKLPCSNWTLIFMGLADKEPLHYTFKISSDHFTAWKVGAFGGDFPLRV